MILCYFVAPLLNILIQYFWTLCVKTNQSYSYSKYRLKEHKLCFNLRGWTTISLYQLQINYSHFLKILYFQVLTCTVLRKSHVSFISSHFASTEPDFIVIFKWSWGIALQAFSRCFKVFSWTFAANSFSRSCNWTFQRNFYCLLVKILNTGQWCIQALKRHIT